MLINKKRKIIAVLFFLFVLSIILFVFANTILSENFKFNIEYREALRKSHPYDSPDVKINIDRYTEHLYSYELSVENCNKCHSFSRALNSQYVSSQWERLVSRMVLKEDSGISVKNAKKIIEFLKFYAKESRLNPTKLITSYKENEHIKNRDTSLSNIITKSKVVINEKYGKILYNNFCASCHSENGEGGVGVKLNGVDMIGLYLRDDARFYRETIKMGRRGTLMHGWSYEYMGNFNNNQIENIIEFIKHNWYEKKTGTLKATEYQIYEELSNANVEEGSFIYNNSCTSCHNGLNPDSLAPDIRNYTFSGLDSQGNPLTIDRGQLRYIIKNGRNDTLMKPFSKSNNSILELSDVQIDSIIKYLRKEPVIYKNER